MLLTVEQAAQQLGTSSASSGACAPKSASPSSRSVATYASTARTSSPTSTPTARKQLTTSSRSTSGRLFGAQGLRAGSSRVRPPGCDCACCVGYFAMSSASTPGERALRARLAAHALHAQVADPAAHTAPARRAFLDRFEREVDPDGELAPA